MIRGFTQFAAVVLLAGSAVALQPAAEKPTPEKQPAQDTATKPAEPPSLDELLGITPEKPAAPAEGEAKPATDTTRTELDRALSPTEIREDFERAVALMGETSQRLNDSRDAGLGTQRLQEDILRMLDKLIKDAEQQQQQSRSSSSSSSSSQQQNQQNQQQQASSQQQQARGDGNNPGPGPARQEAQPRSQAAGNSATWGNLPDHLRDALVQGASDRFSEMYRSLTEEYYKRLAEDPKAEGSPR